MTIQIYTEIGTHLSINALTGIVLYFFKLCVPGFSNFVFRVLVFRRSGIPAFHVLVQA